MNKIKFVSIPENKFEVSTIKHNSERSYCGRFSSDNMAVAYRRLKNLPVSFKPKSEILRKTRLFGAHRHYVTDKGGAVVKNKWKICENPSNLRHQRALPGICVVSVYNPDQRAIMNAFGSMEKDAFYLFLNKF